MTINLNERPIKLVYEGDFTIESDGNYDITISRPVTLSELAAMFGVDEVDIIDGQIGCWVVDEEE